METVFLSLRRFQRWLCGTRVLVQTDRTLVMHYLNMGERDQVQEPALEGSGDYSVVSRISLTAVHISGPDNVEANGLSCHQVENPLQLELSTKWFLDPRVTSLLFGIWGLPTVDLCATCLNNKDEAFLPPRLLCCQATL